MTCPNWNLLCDRVEHQWPPDQWRDTGVIVGCSGGGDSVALVRSLAEIGRRHHGRGFVRVAHFNHRLRGEDSDGDAIFVSSLCTELGLDCEIESEGTAHPVANDEQSLRRIRLDFLQRIAARAGARYVAIGHTADDHIETVLHHLMRGTGPVGLTGIPPHRSLGDDLVLVRPFLGLRRDLIRTSLSEIGQPWRDDASNDSRCYTRNWIRHEVLAMMRSRFPGVDDAILRTSQSVTAWQTVIRRHSRDWVDRAIVWAERPDGRPAATVRIDLSDPPGEAIVIDALQRAWDSAGWGRGRMTAKHWQRLARVIRGGESDTPSTTAPEDMAADLPGGIQIRRPPGSVLLQRREVRQSSS